MNFYHEKRNEAISKSTHAFNSNSLRQAGLRSFDVHVSWIALFFSHFNWGYYVLAKIFWPSHNGFFNFDSAPNFTPNRVKSCKLTNYLSSRACRPQGCKVHLKNHDFLAQSFNESLRLFFMWPWFILDYEVDFTEISRNTIKIQQIREQLPPGLSLWMLCGLDLLFPMLMLHGKAADSGNFSCKKLPLVFRPVLPIVLKTKLRKPWKINRTRESSKPVVSSKMSSENVVPKRRNIARMQNIRCMVALISSTLEIHSTAFVISHFWFDKKSANQVQ